MDIRFDSTPFFMYMAACLVFRYFFLSSCCFDFLSEAEPVERERAKSPEKSVTTTGT